MKFKLQKSDETITSEKTLQALVIKASDSLLPTTYHLGNKIIRNENQDMVIYSVPLQGIQLKKYEEWLQDDESQESVNAIQ